MPKIRTLTPKEQALIQKYAAELAMARKRVAEIEMFLQDLALAFNKGEGPIDLRDGAIWTVDQVPEVR